MLEGDAGDVKERDIDLSPDPRTGKDFKGTKSRIRALPGIGLADRRVQVVSLQGYTDNDTSVSEDFDLTNFELRAGFRYPGLARQLFTLVHRPCDASISQFGVNTDSHTSFSYDQFSQEFRFTGVVGNLEWMADLLYWKEDMDAVMNQQWWARETMDTDYWNSTYPHWYLPFLCTVPGDRD